MVNPRSLRPLSRGCFSYRMHLPTLALYAMVHLDRSHNTLQKCHPYAFLCHSLFHLLKVISFIPAYEKPIYPSRSCSNFTFFIKSALIIFLSPKNPIFYCLYHIKGSYHVTISCIVLHGQEFICFRNSRKNCIGPGTRSEYMHRILDKENAQCKLIY